VAERPNLLADYESASGDSGGGVFAGGELVGVHLGRMDSSARAACRLSEFVSRALKAEPAHAPEPKPEPKSEQKPEPKPEPKLKALPVTSAAPVTLPASGCAGGNCPAPSYAPARGGLFRRW
jgi:hypothetical protein